MDDRVGCQSREKKRLRISYSDNNCAIVKCLMRNIIALKLEKLLIFLSSNYIRLKLFRNILVAYKSRMPFDEQKIRQVNGSVQHLIRYHLEGKSFIKGAIAGDETWV
ncbi:hypothetical protein Trydic_g16659 [Trypoxylus dichotomus]